jgi:hypothetical protein
MEEDESSIQESQVSSYRAKSDGEEGGEQKQEQSK